MSAGQLRLFDPDPTLTPTQAREALRGRLGWQAREVMIDRQGERYRRAEQEAADDRYVPRPDSPKPAYPATRLCAGPRARLARQPLVLAPPPGKVSKMSRSEIESWAGEIVEASKAAVRATGKTFPGDAT